MQARAHRASMVEARSVGWLRRVAGDDFAVVDEEEMHMPTRSTDPDALLTPAEVAALFRVDPKTVTRWAQAGKISSVKTLGGHRRYRESEVYELLDGLPRQRDADS